MLVPTACALAGCGTSVLGGASTPSTAPTTSTTAATTSTTAVSGGVAVAFPVGRCTPAFGVASKTSGWKPTILLAPIPTALVGSLEFYSDGTHTVVGPVDWTCTEIQPSGGATGLVVYPSQNPNPPVSGAPAPGTEGVFALFESTAHADGISLVCPYFAVPSWQQQEAHCPPARPSGEQVSMSTPDVASVTDPAGVIGNLEGSGGVFPVSGVVLFPQAMPAVSEGASLAVAVESCSLQNAALCPSILSDFDVREFPVPPAG